jgi:hypothetical protein
VSLDLRENCLFGRLQLSIEFSTQTFQSHQIPIRLHLVQIVAMCLSDEIDNSFENLDTAQNGSKLSLITI